MSKYLGSSDDIVITGNNKFQYLYKLIKGDGHCFVNCYLNACSPTYKSLPENMKTAYSRKLRIDFANLLMSDSTKTAGEISTRLGFLNPNVLCKFLKLNNGESSLTTLNEICAIYDGTNEDEVFDLLDGADFITTELTDEVLSLEPKKGGKPLSLKKLKELFELDHRILVAKADSIPETELGVGVYPITLKIYELIKYVPSSYHIIDETILRLIHPTQYLEHFDSTLFAEYIGLNAVCFNLGEGGSSYTQVYDLTEKRDNHPEILLVNMLNIHWNMVTFQSPEFSTTVMVSIDSKTKETIFRELIRLNNMGALPII